MYIRIILTILAFWTICALTGYIRSYKHEPVNMDKYLSGYDISQINRRNGILRYRSEMLVNDTYGRLGVELKLRQIADGGAR